MNTIAGYLAARCCELPPEFTQPRRSYMISAHRRPLALPSFHSVRISKTSGPSYNTQPIAGHSDCRRDLDELYLVCSTARDGSRLL